jgi:beta-glucanase (GH16 family)
MRTSASDARHTRSVHRFAGITLVLAVVGAGLVSHLRVDEPAQRAAQPTKRAGPCAAGALPDNTRGTSPTWSDEFNGARVDDRRWTIRDQTTLSFDQARIQARNVSVRNGDLIIEARRESSGARQYTTGYLDTIGRFSQRHGRWEIRARLPVAAGVSRGLWPAFWLRADQAPGEIDVMEAWGTPADHPRTGPATYAWNIHEDTRGGLGRIHGWGTTAGDASLADGFHVFAVDWSPECLVFSLDGKRTGAVSMKAEPWLSRSLRGKVNIRLNLQVGSHFWGRVDAKRARHTKLPARFVVDYVRVYGLQADH